MRIVKSIDADGSGTINVSELGDYLTKFGKMLKLEATYFNEDIAEMMTQRIALGDLLKIIMSRSDIL